MARAEESVSALAGLSSAGAETGQVGVPGVTPAADAGSVLEPSCSELLGWLTGRLYILPPGSPSTQKHADQRVVVGAVDGFGLPDELAPDGGDPEAPMLEPAPPCLVLRALKVCWSTTPV